MLSIRNSFTNKNSDKSKRWRKIYNANFDQKKAQIVVLVS